MDEISTHTLKNISMGFKSIMPFLVISQLNAWAIANKIREEEGFAGLEKWFQI